MVHCCCAYGCTNRFKKGGVGFFRFPKERSRRISWLLALRRKNWVPGAGDRICGEHFITGKPSLDKTHPDYVPTIFSYVKKARRKNRKELCDPLELPDLNSIIKKERDEESESVESPVSRIVGTSASQENRFFWVTDPEEDDEAEHYDFEIQPEPDSVPEFSPLVSVETVKNIISYDRSDVKNPYSDSLSKNSRSKKLFTFIDHNGQMIARFSQKRKVKKRVPQFKYPQPVANSNPVETVQVIIDKKKAQTVAVNRKTLCPAKNKESCTCNRKIGNSGVTKKGSGFYSIEVKIEQNSENEDTGENEDLFIELNDLEQQKKELESKIQNKFKEEVS